MPSAALSLVTISAAAARNLVLENQNISGFYADTDFANVNGVVSLQLQLGGEGNATSRRQ